MTPEAADHAAGHERAQALDHLGLGPAEPLAQRLVGPRDQRQAVARARRAAAGPPSLECAHRSLNPRSSRNASTSGRSSTGSAVRYSISARTWRTRARRGRRHDEPQVQAVLALVVVVDLREAADEVGRDRRQRPVGTAMAASVLADRGVGLDHRTHARDHAVGAAGAPGARARPPRRSRAARRSRRRGGGRAAGRAGTRRGGAPRRVSAGHRLRTRSGWRAR